jgi:hypothetical protein
MTTIFQGVRYLHVGEDGSEQWFTEPPQDRPYMTVRCRLDHATQRMYQHTRTIDGRPRGERWELLFDVAGSSEWRRVINRQNGSS